MNFGTGSINTNYMYILCCNLSSVHSPSRTHRVKGLHWTITIDRGHYLFA